MPAGVWNVDFLVANEQRRYPLAPGASGADASGTFRLPDDFLVGLQLSVHAGMTVSAGRFFLKRLGVWSGGWALTVGYQPDGDDAVDVATATIARSTWSRHRAYGLTGIEPFDDAAGHVVLGRLDGIDGQPPGNFEFEFEAALLDPDCIRPLLRGVTGLTVVSSGQRSERLQGDVELVARANMQIVPVVEGGRARILFSAIDGEGTVEDCECAGGATLPPPIRTINGVAPTADGAWFLGVGDCLEAAPIANGLELKNTCSKPCCGCAELERITEDLKRLKQQTADVRGFADRIAASLTALETNALATRVGTGCGGG